MIQADFKKAYEKAKTMDIVNDKWFNYNAWFWMSLTEKQCKKMYDLMIMQGAKEVVRFEKKCIELNLSKLIVNKL